VNGSEKYILSRNTLYVSIYDIYNQTGHNQVFNQQQLLEEVNGHNRGQNLTERAENDIQKTEKESGY
jgi:hypothetical protein